MRLRPARIIGYSVLTAALIAGAPSVQARERPRSVYCHYRDIDGVRWTDREVKMTIRCGAKHFGVSADTAISIARRESGFSWWARNPRSGACGIYQHLPRYWPGRQNTFGDRHPFWTIAEGCENARANVLVALDMVRRYGWSAWS